MEVYLTAAILCAGTYQSTTQTAIHRLLTCGLARSLRIRHGLLVDGVPVSIDQVRYLLNAITSHLTPDGDVPDGGEQRILDQIVDRIVSATIPDRFATPRAVAMDATAVKSFARGKRRTTNADPATDPDTAVVETGPAADPTRPGATAPERRTTPADACSATTPTPSSGFLAKASNAMRCRN